MKKNTLGAGACCGRTKDRGRGVAAWWVKTAEIRWLKIAAVAAVLALLPAGLPAQALAGCNWSTPGPLRTAVIDRIVDGRFAVLQVNGDEGLPLQRVVAAADLPLRAREGTWLRVRFSGKTLITVMIDDEATMQARQRVQWKIELLRQR